MHIGFASAHPFSTFWTMVSHGVRRAGVDFGTKVTALGAETYQEQLRSISELVAQQVDALIIGPVETKFLMPVIEGIVRDGIPVVTVGVHIPNSPAISAVYADNVAGGELAASYIVEQLAGKGKVLYLQGPAGVAENAERGAGFRQVVERYPDIQAIYSGHGDWTPLSGMALMAAALAEHPDIDAVFVANDTMAFGAVNAIVAAGRAGQICVVGFDGLPEALLRIRDGKMAGTVFQDSVGAGHSAFDLAARAATGAPVPPVVYAETRLITQANLIDSMAAALTMMPVILNDALETGIRLNRERALLRSVLDAVPETHIFIKDRQGRFMMVNRAHLISLGAVDVEDVIGKTHRELLPDELAAQYDAEEQAVISSGVGVHNRVESMPGSDGARKWYLTSKVPLYGDEGSVTGLIGISRDITMLKTLEEEQQRLQAEIIRAQEQALRELSAPLMPIGERVMVMPLIGSISAERAQFIFDSLLHGVAEHHAQTMIIDVTGVTIGDIRVADTLLRAAQAIKLLGAQTIVTGIRPEIAENFVSLGTGLEDLITRSTLQSGIDYALRRVRSGS
jgi:PAS domain S-box-containing protein